MSFKGHPVGFIPRTHCPEGHDLNHHGYQVMGQKRCRICQTVQVTKLNKSGIPTDARYREHRTKKQK